MTNKEAIKTLKIWLVKNAEYVSFNEEESQAVNLAIKALEREETCENKDCGTEMIFECSVCGAKTIDRLNWEDGEFNYCPNCGRKIIEQKPKKEKK